jgi:hypothetical protein
MTETAPTARTRSIRIRVTDGEAQVLRDTARRSGCTVSALVRSAVAERWLRQRVDERTGHEGHQP